MEGPVFRLLVWSGVNLDFRPWASFVEKSPPILSHRMPIVKGKMESAAFSGSTNRALRQAFSSKSYQQVVNRSGFTPFCFFLILSLYRFHPVWYNAHIFKGKERKRK
jgi:hypothetical protein